MTTDTQVNALEMSDEDFLKLAPPVVAEAATEVAEKPAATTEVEAADKPATEAVAGDADDAADAAAEAAAKVAADAAADVRARAEDGKFKAKTDAAAAEAAAKAASDSAAAKAATDAAKQTPEEKQAAVDKAAEQAAIDYKAQYERLLTPFKANGREVQVRSVDDAIALMQMGANYNKKMAALKPNLKLLKALENNGLLDEGKINYLIDLAVKNPQAIQKLVSDAGIDPMELDAEKAKSYKATSYAVDEREIELDTILEDLQGSPAYTQTLDVVSNKWDLASKQTISKTPQLLKVIHDHVASGVYDLISTEMSQERMLGRLNGLSDIEAYRQVGDAIHARGGFNHLAPADKPAAAAVTKPTPPAVVAAKAKTQDNDELKDKRRAASSTKPVSSAKPSLKDFNPLSMSDEDFQKLSTPKFA